ncbi:sigma-70 family RNA polymerase sigma factor [Haliovirga abyssi]|uniref:RNA polymerase sigma factor SigS n=1 Tax=Haliovirga abyssi TaxID=2996794 RepID=A0AAU9DRG2_9FUSO|nr:sigma-70 family RNA polymerase sigma factor [Haliovirga abyssi]BDU51163.1 RNA polymerase factor sigma-70 [Haliovirga abyssi]
MQIKDLDEKLIEEAKSGNEDAVNEIFTEYKDFVYIKSKNYFLIGADHEDLIQEGMIGLLKAIRGYDSNKLASFKTFASICIKRQLISAIKSSNTKKNKALNKVVNDYVDDNYDSSKYLESYIIYNPEEIYISREQIEGLKSYLKKNLSKFEYNVFKKMMCGESYTEIAETMDKKTKAIDNAMQRIKRKSEYWLEKYKKGN